MMDTPNSTKHNFTDACLESMLDTLEKEKENGRQVVFIVGHGSMDDEIFQKLQAVLSEDFVVERINVSKDGTANKGVAVHIGHDRTFDRHRMAKGELFFNYPDCDVMHTWDNELFNSLQIDEVIPTSKHLQLQPIPHETTLNIWDLLAGEVMTKNKKRKIPRSERIPHMERAGYGKRRKV